MTVRSFQSLSFLEHSHSCTYQTDRSVCNKNTNSASFLNSSVYRDRNTCSPICSSSMYDTTTGEQVEAAIYYHESHLAEILQFVRSEFTSEWTNRGSALDPALFKYC